MIEIVPCKICEDRKVGCHADCERYIEWRKAFDAEKQALRDAVKNDVNYSKYKHDVVKEVERRKKWHKRMNTLRSRQL